MCMTTECMLKAGACIPKTGKTVGKPMVVPGWNNETECLKQQALF